MAAPIAQAYDELVSQPELIEYFKDEFDIVKVFREEIASYILEDDNMEQYMPFARLNDITNEKTKYASNRPLYTESVLQLSVWNKTFGELDVVDEILEELMPRLGYIEIYGYTTKDPDIDKPYLVKRYRYSKQI